MLNKYGREAPENFQGATPPFSHVTRSVGGVIGVAHKVQSPRNAMMPIVQTGSFL